MAPTHSGSPSHARDARHCCGRSKQNIYHRHSSRKARPRQRLIRARQLSFRLASRAGDGSDPAFSHLCWLPALPDRWAWAPLSWTGWLTPSVSVAWVPATVPGRTGWVRLHKGTNRIPRLLSRIRLLASNLWAPCLRASSSLAFLRRFLPTSVAKWHPLVDPAVSRLRRS